MIELFKLAPLPCATRDPQTARPDFDRIRRGHLAGLTQLTGRSSILGYKDQDEEADAHHAHEPIPWAAAASSCGVFANLCPGGLRLLGYARGYIASPGREADPRGRRCEGDGLAGLGVLQQLRAP